MLSVSVLIGMHAASAVVLHTDPAGHRPSPRRSSSTAPNGEPAAPATFNTTFRQKQINVADMQYYSLGTVGSQNLHIVMDTGSTDLVVLSDKCGAMCKEGNDRRHLFHPQRSKTYRGGTQSSVFSYGSGDLTGHEAYDSFQIGPYSTSGQLFWEVVRAQMPLLKHSDFQVILGLGPDSRRGQAADGPNVSTPSAEPGLLERLKINSYSICMMPHSGEPGYITWNDKTIETRPRVFTQVPSVGDDFWMAEISDVMLGDTPIACEKKGGGPGCGALLDTGTSLLAMPGEAYGKLSSFIWDLGPDCRDMSAMPDLHFKLGGADFSLPPDSYLGEVLGDPQGSMLRYFRKSNQSCQEALMYVDMQSSLGDTWVLGMPFFRAYYTVFVQGREPKLYFAKANKKCRPASINRMGLYPVERHTKARHIDAQRLSLSPTLQRAALLGRLDGRKRARQSTS